jgi:hypothetical protein
MPTNMPWMARGLTALIGAAAFSGAQVWAFVAQPGPGAYYEEPRGWFLNSGTSVAMIAGAIAIAAAVAAIARDEATPWSTAGAITAGGCLAMVVVLVTIGMGNLFPIVLIMGGVIISGAAICGTLVGYGARQLAGRAPAKH